ncbi:hypothetical protein EV426DRAFT_584409 [Tirmania nivea]|nr:hypothetical protein EV426DRAFT_584409 [Tirmania nivea]
MFIQCLFLLLGLAYELRPRVGAHFSSFHVSSPIHFTIGGRKTFRVHLHTCNQINAHAHKSLSIYYNISISPTSSAAPITQIAQNHIFVHLNALKSSSLLYFVL